MANKMFPKGRQAFAAGDLDWDAHDFKVALLPAAYVYNAAHDNLDDVLALATPVATSGNLANKTNVDGLLDSDDIVFASVSGSTITQAILYRDTGTSATSRLVAHYDTGPFPTTPNGGNITLVVNASGWLTI